MSKVITETRLWRNTLATQKDDPYSSERERLRSVFVKFHEHAAFLVNEITRDMPDYTVHDITHLDSLWEMADIIAGDKYPLTPTEAFVFGGAVLLHDAGMALASYPEGLESLKKKPEWRDLIVVEFQKQRGRTPNEKEMLDPPEEVRGVATAGILRLLHAKQAESLALNPWKKNTKDSPKYLIEDDEIRTAFGRIVGLIASSHWRTIDHIEKEFAQPLGPPHWCPSQWAVEPLKIACLLRVADIAHIDARRAPAFLCALRKPTSGAVDHWNFQEKLQKPQIIGDALAYTSGYAFPIQEASAWWLCLDALTEIDRELQQVDVLLAEKGIRRFVASRVAGIEYPERLVHYIPTDGWLPVRAVLQVSDIPRLVQKLGGEELYGKNPQVAVRELIQNSADAIRARRLLEGRPDNWGIIYVRVGEDKRGHWLEVEDNGIGMSSEVLTKELLDFGKCHWGSERMLQEFPGLLSSGFVPIGKYGIGFFSVFMLGETVRITTRRLDAAKGSTLILEFGAGLSERPILHNAQQEEMLLEGGTRVRIWLKVPPLNEGGVINRYGESRMSPKYNLSRLCKYLCPSLDVTVITEEYGKMRSAISASDWSTCSGSELYQRLDSGYKQTLSLESRIKIFMDKGFPNIRLFKDAEGRVIGRACLMPNLGDDGVVTVGGLRSASLSGIIGILAGTSLRAGRDDALPLVAPNVLAMWATEQAELISSRESNKGYKLDCAQYVWRCNGKTGPLPIAMNQGSWLTYDDIANNKNLPPELLLLDSSQYVETSKYKTQVEFKSNVFFSNIFSVASILHSRDHYDWPHVTRNEFDYDFFYNQTLAGAIIDAAAKSWGVSVESVYSNMSTDGKCAVAKVKGKIVNDEAIIIRKPSSRKNK